MTPLKINYIPRDGKRSYWFADPYVCHCLYVGNDENFQQFKQLKQSEQQEGEAQEVTDMAEQTKCQEFTNSPARSIFYRQ